LILAILCIFIPFLSGFKTDENGITNANSFTGENQSMQLLNCNYGPVRDNPEDLDLLFGWPRQMTGEIPIWGRCPTVLNFDGNHDWELSLMTTDNRLYVFQHDGAFYPGFPLPPRQGDRPRPWENPRHIPVSAMGDISGNGLPDLVYITDLGFLHVVAEDRDEPDSFPLDLGRGLIAGIPALIDLNDDDVLEIVFNNRPTHPDSMAANAWMHIVNNTGNELQGWPVPYPRGSGSSPAVGNITGNNNVEIVVGNARHVDSPAQIWAWRTDGIRVPGFPTGSFQTIHGAPTLADLDGNGTLEIIIWAAAYEDDQAGIYAFNGDGSVVDGFPLSCPIGHPEGSPAVADINGDGDPEIVFGTYNPNGGMIYAWAASGELLDSFPVEFERPIVGSVLLADMSGDSIGDIIAVLAPSEGVAGEIAALDHNGEMIPEFPLSLRDHNDGAFAGTPTIWDIDRDHYLDIIAATTDRRVLIWRTQGRVTHDVWMTFKGDMNRSGMRPADNPNDVPLHTNPSAPKEFDVSVFPNPFNDAAIVQFHIEHTDFITIELIDHQGRLIKRLFEGDTEVGRFDLAIDAVVLNMAAGLYFCRWRSDKFNGAVRLLYMP